jgi:hypothetical protein
MSAWASINTTTTIYDQLAPSVQGLIFFANSTLMSEKLN